MDPPPPETLGRLCLATSPDRMWSCSLQPEHSGNHMAYTGHVLSQEHFRSMWTNLDARPEEIETTLASIRDAITRKTRDA